MQSVCPLQRKTPSPFVFFSFCFFFPSQPSVLLSLELGWGGREQLFFSVMWKRRQAVHGSPQCVTLMTSLVECITRTVRSSSLHSSPVCLPAASVGRHLHTRTHKRARAHTHSLERARAIFISSSRTGLDFSAPSFTPVRGHLCVFCRPCFGLDLNFWDYWEYFIHSNLELDTTTTLLLFF